MGALNTIGWILVIFLVIPGTFLMGLWFLFQVPGVRPWFERNEKNFKVLGGICLGLLAVWYIAIGIKTGQEWDGSGTINVFPSSDSAKNYRLDTDTISVKVKRDGLFHNYNTYEISSANWPDGGTLEFDGGCYVSEEDGRDKCTDQNGTGYYVEVQTPPDQPESDYNNN